MRKQQLKNYLKLGILLFGITFLLWNCENNSEQIETMEQKIDFTVKPQIKTFTLNQLQNDNTFGSLKNSFNILQNNTLFASRNANGTSYSARLVDSLGISIDESSIRQITYDGYVSYTMLMIEPDDNSGNTSNLVIQDHNGSERIFTVRYTNDANDSGIASRNSSQSDNVQMRSGIRSYSDFWQDDEGNSSSGASDCEQYETVCNTVYVWIPVSCGCGHSGDDPCDGCYGSYAGWELGTEQECEEICVDYGSGIYDSGSGNPSTGGGGSTSGNTTPTEVATTPLNLDGTSAFQDGPPKTNCESLKALRLTNSLNIDILPYVNQLRAKLDETKEWSIGFTKEWVDGNMKNAPWDSGIKEGINLTRSYYVSGTREVGQIHTHPDGTKPIFSWLDLKALKNIYHDAHEHFQDDVFLMIVCKNGSTYSLKVDDLETLIIALQADLDNAKGNTEKKKEDYIEERLERKFRESDNLEQTFLKEYGNHGISLYKATDTNLNNWKQLELDENDNETINETPCN
jgi:hypothetical protein